MQLRPAIQIQSMIKSITDVVLPAIDAGNKPALEQVRLVLGMLAMLGERLPLEYRFDRDELGRLLGFARDLSAAAGGGEAIAASLRALDDAAGPATLVHDHARVEPVQLTDAVRRLRSATGDVIQAVFASGTDEARDRVRQQVLAMSAEQLKRDRAWVITQGWEPDPASLVSIEALLGPT